MKQPEALRLADDLVIDYYGDTVAYKAAAELRRLHEANQAMLEALTCMKQAQDNGCSHEEWEVALRKRDAAIAKGEQNA